MFFFPFLHWLVVVVVHSSKHLQHTIPKLGQSLYKVSGEHLWTVNTGHLNRTWDHVQSRRSNNVIQKFKHTYLVSYIRSQVYTSHFGTSLVIQLSCFRHTFVTLCTRLAMFTVLPTPTPMLWLLQDPAPNLVTSSRPSPHVLWLV